MFASGTFLHSHIPKTFALILISDCQSLEKESALVLHVYSLHTCTCMVLFLETYIQSVQVQI